MPQLFNDAKHWRERAAQAREVAKLISDAVARATMLEIAERYERLARQVEGRAIANHDPAADDKGTPP
jgi:hypothetical protein